MRRAPPRLSSSSCQPLQAQSCALSQANHFDWYRACTSTGAGSVPVTIICLARRMCACPERLTLNRRCALRVSTGFSIGFSIGFVLTPVRATESLPWRAPLACRSFGASAVLVYGAPNSPLAQPPNLVLGTVLSAAVGVAVRVAFVHAQGPLWLACGVSVALAIAVMGATRTTHPPGGALALIAVIGGKRVEDVGWWFVLLPGLACPLVLLLVGLILNNLDPRRSYPVYWRL